MHLCLLSDPSSPTSINLPLSSMSTTKGLFVSSLTSLEIVASLPYSYEMRSLEKDDFDKGYLDCLRVLTYDGDLTAEEFKERYDEMDAVNTQGPGTYFLLVIEYENRILGTGTLIIERKLYVFTSYPG